MGAHHPGKEVSAYLRRTYVDVILSRYPMARPYGISADKCVIFKNLEDGELVGLVMPFLV